MKSHVVVLPGVRVRFLRRVVDLSDRKGRRLGDCVATTLSHTTIDLLRSPGSLHACRASRSLQKSFAHPPACGQRSFLSPPEGWWVSRTETDEAAAQAAHECLLLAQAMESASAIYLAYELLGRVSRKAGQMPAVATAVVQEWRWARRVGSVEYRHDALADCAHVRLLQGRVACGLPATWGTLPQQLPAEADHALAARRVQSARRWLGWARPLAEQLDRASGTRSSQEELDWLIREAAHLEALLGKKGNA